jgi:8-oxo-dGTP pyrophosphatase MutT (NUDIX family)
MVEGQPWLGPADIARRLAAPARESRSIRAGVIVVRNGRVAVIERERSGRRYWVLPGGGSEPGETPSQSAQREAEEELSVPVRIGPLRVVVHHPQPHGGMLLHWYFSGSVDTDAICIGGPERDGPADDGSYAAVWLHSADLRDGRIVWPVAVAELVAANGGAWPDTVLEVLEPS